MTARRILRPVVVELFGRGLPRGARVAARRRAGDEALAVATRQAGAPGTLRWEQRPDHPPTAPGGWYGSLTNTPHLAAAVVAREPVGIDAEWSGRPRLEAARTRLLETGELDRLGRDGRLAVLTLWTAKEAVLKRAGVGIAGFTEARLVREDERGLTFTFAGEELSVTVLAILDHLLAVAVRQGARSIVEPVLHGRVVA